MFAPQNEKQPVWLPDHLLQDCPFPLLPGAAPLERLPAPPGSLALPGSLGGSSFLAASACPPESCFVGDRGNLEHGTILSGGTVGPALLSVDMCAGSQPRATWTRCWPWHSRRKTGGSKRTTYDVLCSEHFTVNIAYGNGGP